MRNYIFSFLFGVAVTISFAATTTDLLTIKPAKPISTVCYTGSAYTVSEFIDKYQKLGYQVDTVTATTTGNLMVIVMVKY